MKVMATADGHRNPRIFIESSLISEAAAVAARRKRREMRRFTQRMANSADVRQSFNTKCSHSLSVACCEEGDGEQVDWPLSEGDAPIQSLPLRQMKRKEIPGDSSVRGDMKCGGLVRSMSSPPEGWEKGVNRCLAFVQANKMSTTRDGRCQGAASDKFGSTGDAGPVTDCPSTVYSPVAQDVAQPEPEKEIRKCDERLKDVATLDKRASQAKLNHSGATTSSSPSLCLKTISKPVPEAVKKSCVSDGRCPPYGKLSVLGRRREMEDTVAVIPHFVTLPCGAIGGCCDEPPGSTSISALHFFGVYDGHGGAQASHYCETRLHNALAEEIIAVASFTQEGDCNDICKWAPQWKRAMAACFLKMDREVGGVCPNGECSDLVGSSNCCANTIAPGTVGSTAVVAVVSPGQIIVGNCGDSRAVLLRAGKALSLSTDHKPEREDERNRIETAGGRVVNWDGYRVGGLLAMSRAIGDRFLKPYVIAEPEVTCIERTEEDECLILASDGLWDVVSNDVACEVGRRCLAAVHRKLESGYACHTDEAPATATAALLVKLALARGSKDNISVVVVDLKTRD